MAPAKKCHDSGSNMEQTVPEDNLIKFMEILENDPIFIVDPWQMCVFF